MSRLGILWVFFSLNCGAITVIIDPGHGGVDRGAVKANKVESKIALDVAHRLAKNLQKNKSLRVIMTRTNDSPKSLRDRAEFAKQNRGDIFVSIHANSSPDSRAKGAEFFFQNQLSPDSESMFLARRELHHHGLETDEERMSFGPRHRSPVVQSILEDLIRNRSIHESSQLATSLVENWRGLKKSKRYVIQQAPFYVVSNVPMPSVLVELGFLTHKKEGQLLTSASYKNKLARSISTGIIKYKELLDKVPR